MRGVDDANGLCDWFETRCFLRTREDVEFQLEALGLTECPKGGGVWFC